MNTAVARARSHQRRVFDAQAIEGMLDSQGFATIPGVLSEVACREIAELYDDESRFRSRVIMSRHGYGRGEYQYFSYPLPDEVGELRSALYAAVVDVANRWQVLLRQTPEFPSTHAEFLQQCHDAGQVRPTPLLLKYRPGDYNCLHQDLYGAHVFPLQMAILLSDPKRDFSGGDFVLTEQRPRMQSRAHVVSLGRGDAVIFPVRYRPVQGSRGTYRTNLRHGVSTVTDGARMTLGIILHDAA
jgi:hypothetical protein